MPVFSRGGNLIHDISYIGSVLTSLPQINGYCDEIIKLIKHIIKNDKIKKDKSIIELIDKVTMKAVIYQKNIF